MTDQKRDTTRSTGRRLGSWRAAERSLGQLRLAALAGMLLVLVAVAVERSEAGPAVTYAPGLTAAAASALRER